jgi:hypothetical protein
MYLVAAVRVADVFRVRHELGEPLILRLFLRGTLTSTFQNAITTFTLGFPTSSVSSCTVTRITTLGSFCARFRPFALNNFRLFDLSNQALHKYPS